jgi:hypothetical protein
LAATLRDLDLFQEKSLSEYLSIAIRNKILKILEPVAAKPVKVKREPKAPRSQSRIPEIERNIALGLQLLELKAKTKSNREFGRERNRLFDIDTQAPHGGGQGVRH